MYLYLYITFIVEYTTERNMSYSLQFCLHEHMCLFFQTSSGVLIPANNSEPLPKVTTPQSTVLEDKTIQSAGKFKNV